jgi:hypothetical protein
LKVRVPDFGRTSLDELRDCLVGTYYITLERAQEQFGGAYCDDDEVENDEE